MKRGHVPRLAAQVANFGLFLLIIAVCGFVAWRASQYKAFVVPDGYIAGYVDEGGFLWKKERVRVFETGTYPVLQNEQAASSPAYRLGKQSFVFHATAKVDVAIWKDARNLLTRRQAPIIRVHGEIEASVTKDTVEALLLSRESIDSAMRDAVVRVLAKSAKENASSKQELEEALLGGLAENLAQQVHLNVHRIQVDDVAEVDSTAPATVRLPPDFVIHTETVNKTPPTAYASVGLAILVGALVFLVMRLLFADLIALVILTPFQWMGLMEGVHWRVREDEEKVQENGSVVIDAVVPGFPSPSDSEGGAAPSGSDPVVGPTVDADPASGLPGAFTEGLDVGVEIPGEIASGAAEAATAATEAVGGLAGGLADAALGGCVEGCLGGIFG